MHHKILQPSYIIIFILALLSYKLIDYRILTRNNLTLRNEIYSGIAGKREIPPSNTFIVSTAAGISLQKIVKFFFRNSNVAHLTAHSILIFLIFFFLYFAFYRYLRIFFDDKYSIIGTMLTGVVITLGLRELFPEGEILNFLVYTSGFLLMFKAKDYLLPFITGIAALNDAQPFFLMILYITYLISEKKLNTRKAYLVILSSLIFIFICYFPVKIFFGYNIFTLQNHLTGNVSNPGLMFQFLFSTLFIFLFLSIKAFHFTSLFFKFGLVLMFLYLLYSFFFTLLNDTGRLLPAYLVLIPMSLQTLTGKTIRKSENSFQTS